MKTKIMAIEHINTVLVPVYIMSCYLFYLKNRNVLTVSLSTPNEKYHKTSAGESLYVKICVPACLSQVFVV